MSTKPMKIVDYSDKIVHMRGYGYDNNAVAMGIPPREASFEDYGLSIYHDGNEIEKCVLHMFDRNVDIEYYNRYIYIACHCIGSKTAIFRCIH